MTFFGSKIGKKYMMGVTGLIWSGFVLMHMLGNLLIFAGPKAYNSYSHAIVSNHIVLYGAEVVLLLSLAIHISLAVLLNRESKKARGSSYYMTPNGQKGASLASRTMVFTGAIILVFVIYHLITFKYGPHYTAVYGGVEMRDLYALVIEVFKNPAYVGGYVFCLLVLGIHLSHGVGSMFKSWGFNHPKYTPWLERFGYVYAVIVAAGFISQPIFAMMQR